MKFDLPGRSEARRGRGRLRGTHTRLKRIPPGLRPHIEAVPTADFRRRFDIRFAFSRNLFSRFPAWRERHRFAEVRWFTLFVGWPRSGHSLFGALLDAHPDFTIAHELDVLPLLDAGLSARQLYWLIERNARAFASAPNGRGWTGYSYAVPGQWQGRSRSLRVMGDKKGGATTHHLAVMNPGALDDLRHRIEPAGLKVIFYHRNPFDMLASNCRRAGLGDVPERVIDQAIERTLPTLERIRAGLGAGERIDVYHEDFVADPATELRSVVESFGEQAADDYLAAAAGIVHPRPHQTRDAVGWAGAGRNRLQSSLDGCGFLARYASPSGAAG